MGSPPRRAGGACYRRLIADLGQPAPASPTSSSSALERAEDEARFHSGLALSYDLQRQGALDELRRAWRPAGGRLGRARARHAGEAPRTGGAQPTPASEERERTERRDRAERRAAAIKSVRDGETLDQLAERLGLPVPVVEELTSTSAAGGRCDRRLRLASPIPGGGLRAPRWSRRSAGRRTSARSRRRSPRRPRPGRPDGPRGARRQAADADQRGDPGYLGELAEADRQHVA